MKLPRLSPSIRPDVRPDPLVARSSAGGIEPSAYLDFSTNWKAPQTIEMSKRATSNCVMTCKAVAAYSNMAGRTSGAMIVAGAHPTPTDSKPHITVRLYKNGNHEKSCHVYVGKNGRCDGNCSCEWTD